MWRSHGEATHAAERYIAGFTHLLAEQTERTIQAIDFTLIGMRDHLLLAPDLLPDDPAYRATLKHRLESISYVRGLFVIGPDGVIKHDTNYPVTPRKSYADRPYFKVHRENPGVGLHVGPPLRSRSTGVWFFSLSRGIAKPDGSFGGAAVAAVEPRYFKRFYKDLAIGEGGTIALLLRDGTLLARVPHHDATIGTSYANDPIRKMAMAQGSGVGWTTHPTDGTRQVVGYRAVAGGSLIVTAGLPARAVYDAWLGHAAVVGVGSIVVWVLASWLALLWMKYRRREQMERRRRAQGQRLETMGRIAGGIAHDLGNTIRIARTTFALLKPSLASQGDAMALIEDADRSLKSAFEIIDRLLAFARRQELSPRPTNLAELIAGFAPILRQGAGPHVELSLDIAKPLVCSIDPIHLESALLNLVLNSKDAFTGEGRIHIALTEAQPPRRGYGRPWAEIAVKDNGAGMPRGALERAFEPFFTTRSGGSGLGLSQVLGFVQQSAGDIRIDSQEGSGTTVRLLFPTISEPVAPAVEDRPASAG
jgi:signal transduction histidine kinase